MFRFLIFVLDFVLVAHFFPWVIVFMGCCWVIVVTMAQRSQ